MGEPTMPTTENQQEVKKPSQRELLVEYLKQNESHEQECMAKVEAATLELQMMVADLQRAREITARRRQQIEESGVE